jgi:hypothetical protein
LSLRTVAFKYEPLRRLHRNRHQLLVARATR